VRLLLAIALLVSAAPAAAQLRAESFTCTADAGGSGLTARTQRLLDRRGDLRSGTTIVQLPLTGAAATLQATWQVRDGLPEVARGIYLFRVPAAPAGTWQLAALGKPIRAKDGSLALSGKQFSALLAGGAPIRLILAGRDGREQGRAVLDRSTFDAAIDLARQSDARGLAMAANFRSLCPRGN
jgi:hypothetical protein